MFSILIDGASIHCERGLDCPQRTASGFIIADMAMDGRGAGVRIRNATTDVLIDGVHLHGYEAGVLLEGTSCETCELRINGSRFTGIRKFAVLSTATDTRIVVSNSSVTTIGGGEVFHQKYEGVQIEWTVDATSGIHLELPGTRLRIDNVTFDAERESKGPAIRLADSTHTAITSSTIRQYRFGILGDLASTAVLGLTIDCVETGLRHDRPTPLRLANVDVAHCTKAAIDSGGTAQVELTNLRLENNHVGLLLEGAKELTLDTFQLAHNDYGLKLVSDPAIQTTGLRPRGTIRNGIVTDNAFVGMEASWAHTSISNVTFSSNGARWPDQNYSQAAAVYGGLVAWHPTTYQAPGSVRVTGSSFVGNRPYALSNVNLGVVEAPDNWWGSATGPTMTPFVPGHPLSSENAVSGNVVAFPFKTTP